MRKLFQQFPLLESFIWIEGGLYLLILTTNNKWVMLASIALSLLFSLSQRHRGDRYIVAALCFTLVADFFLVLCTEQQRLWGMVFFLGAQTMYAVRLQMRRRNVPFLIARVALIVVALAITVLVLKENTDALALISLCYYANMVTSIIEGFSQYRINKLFPVGLVLFLLCDTVIGLQMMASSYIPVADTSVLYDILYPGFNLAWFFYLPSQVLLAISGGCNRIINQEEVS